jgi:hypothetical protein
VPEDTTSSDLGGLTGQPPPEEDTTIENPQAEGEPEDSTIENPQAEGDAEDSTIENPEAESEK